MPGTLGSDRSMRVPGAVTAPISPYQGSLRICHACEGTYTPPACPEGRAAALVDMMEVYQPGAIVMCGGADSLSGDRLNCFTLSLQGHPQCSCPARVL